MNDLDIFNKPGPIKDWWEIQKSDAGFVRDWRVIGPFNYGVGLENEYPIENEINFEEKYDGLVKNLYWGKEKTSKSGYLNFISIFGKMHEGLNPRMEGIAYAYTEIISPDEREVKITIGSNDGAKIWINDKIVYNLHVGRNAVADQDVLSFDL